MTENIRTLVDSTSIQLRVFLEKTLQYAPPWLTPQVIIDAAVVLGLLSLGYNLALILQKKQLNKKISSKDGFVRKLQTELREKEQHLKDDERKILQQKQIIEEQRKLVETSPLTQQLKKTQGNQDFSMERRHWERLDKVGSPSENTPLKPLLTERDDINGLIELAKVKYHTRAIDEKSFSNITEDYQKRLIELESKIKKVEESRAETSQDPSKVQKTQSPVRDQMMVLMQSKVAAMSDNNILLVSSKSDNQSEVVSTILETLIKQKGMAGVYISMSRPYDNIQTMMQSMGVYTNNLHFIDCVTGMSGKSPRDNGQNVVFVENPSSLEEVTMYLDRALNTLKKTNRFILLDNLSSMLIYNSDKSVKEFTHFIINRIRLEGIAGVILTIEKKEAEDLMKTLSPMCDAEIRL
jgi:hypothetical protein